MALPADFNKIYGSTATGGLTPISDVNYAKGWEFVGANPPTKNDFSYLQNLSDIKSQWLYGNKLQRSDPFGDIKADGNTAIATALNNLGLGNGHGRFSTVKRINTSGNYTWPSDVYAIEVIITGGGGGGGGCNAINTSQTYMGAGGGGGGTVFGVFSSADSGFGPGTYPVTVGLGGNGGYGAAAGSNGGDTTAFGMTAQGGKGGGKEAADSTPGGSGGTASGGYHAVAGAAGADGQSTNRSISGNGGASFWSGGGRSANLSAPINRGGIGDGGGGAYDMLFRGVNGTGANGGNGVIIIREYR